MSLSGQVLGQGGSTLSSGPESYLGSQVEWLHGWTPGSGTDEQTGRAGVTSGAARRAGPRLLNPELGSDKGLSGGRGRGRAGRGQSWAGPGRPLPLQRRSQTLSEWRGPAGAGRTGAGELGAGQWQSGAPAPSLGIGEIWARGGA